jgi:divalent metal cation (Fe/Co/Zn/Cd) transporter
LIGEGADPALTARLREIVQRHKAVLRINELLTLHQGPEDLLVTVSVDFHENLSANGVEAAISELEIQMKRADSAVRRVFIEAQSWRAHDASVREEQR